MRWCSLLILGLYVLTGSVALSAEKTKGKDPILDLPKAPSSPPVFERPKEIKAFRCERKVIYRGQELPCDSNVSKDGENLRPILTQVPAAVAELDEYQGNRKNVRAAAYVGTAGLAIGLIGIIVMSSLTHEDSGRLTLDGVAVRNILVFGGFGLAAGSAIHAFGSLQSNEEHFYKAVDLYNNARPNDAIQLQFAREF